MVEQHLRFFWGVVWNGHAIGRHRQVISFDKAARFKACNDAITAVGRARNILAKNDAGRLWNFYFYFYPR